MNLGSRNSHKTASRTKWPKTAPSANLLRMNDKRVNHNYYNFLESDWSINLPIRALIGHLHVIGHLQSEIVILMINW